MRTARSLAVEGAGSLLLPFEIRELMRGITAWRSALFVGNMAVVLYMLYVIRENRRERQRLRAAMTEEG